MKRYGRLFAGAAAYTVLLVLIATYYIVKGNPNYLTYRSYIRSLPKEEVKTGSIVIGANKNSDDKEQQKPGKVDNTTNTGANSGTNTNTTNTNTGSETGNKGNEQNQQGQTSPANTGSSETGKTSTAPAQAKNYEDVQFTRMLKVGLEGEDVKKLQYLLTNKKLYSGSISGVFDEKTKEAVRKFQNQNQLPADGVAGSVTWTKLLE